MCILRTTLAGWVLAGTTLGQGLEPRIYDLRALLRGADSRLSIDATEPFVVPLAMPLTSDLDRDGETFEPGGSFRIQMALGRGADGQPLLDWLVGALHVGSDPGTLRVGEVRTPGRVLIEASADGHARIARRLADLESAALRPIEVELIRLPPSSLAAVPTDGVIEAGVIDALLANHPPLGVWRRSTRTGVSTVVRGGEVRTYLRDVEVEVASGAEISDPKLDLLGFGLLATVRVSRRPRGGAVVLCAVRRTAENATSRIVDTEHARIRLPVVDVELHEFRSVLQSDGAIVLGAATGPGSIWVLRVRGLGGARPDTVPLGGIEPLPWRGLNRERIGTWPLRPLGFDFVAADDARPEWSPLELSEAIDQHDQSEDVPGLRIGDSWVAARESAALARVRALAQTYAAGSAVAVRYAVAIVDAGRAAALARGGVDLDELAANAWARGVLPTRVGGDLAVATVGSEHAFIHDHDVEIAQEASIANPHIDSWFEGVSVRLEVRENGPDSYQVRGEVGCQRAVTGAAPLERRAYDRGPLDAPQIDHAGAEVDVEIPAGQWRLVEIGPIGRGGAQIAVMLRVDA